MYSIYPKLWKISQLTNFMLFFIQLQPLINGRFDYSRFHPNIRITIGNIQIHVLSLYNNYTLCDFTILKLALITIKTVNDNEISLNFRSA